jgi:hypothetical protein
MYSVPLQKRLPNPGLPPRGFPPRPEEYGFHLPTHNHLEPSYISQLPKYDRDWKENSVLEEQAYKLSQAYFINHAGGKINNLALKDEVCWCKKS